ncbi:serine carboxypeptidase III precursor [Angomonas deanei]|nr:serine carboxypeptidase III precursor [Angomonas deanei]|eukprot:EPY26053.1 serine carboxypeptidase III precursor [Angomonas deanei]
MKTFACFLLLTLLLSTVLSALHVPPTVTTHITHDGVRTTIRETTGGWPQCAPQEEQWSGYFDIPGRTPGNLKHYFYWLFGPRTHNPDAPIILWMTGGPGCSSTLAMLVELGPCAVNPTTIEVEENPWSWNEEAYLLFVDQPAGVGFSHADKDEWDRNQAQVAEDMFQFVQALLTAHPTLRQNRLFVVGESYGGHYAPATAHRIVQGNTRGEGEPIRLAGLGVGNGLTDSSIQYPLYHVMAYDYCEQKLGTPCVTKEERDEMASYVPRCKQYIDYCNAGDTTPAADACNQAQRYCQSIPAAYYATGRNPYDIRRQCDPDVDLCYNLTHVDAFLNRPEVQTALGVDPFIAWESCNMDVNSMFAVDFFKNFNTSVAAVLEAGVPVLIYAGDTDFICNWIGNKAWLLSLNWTRQGAFAEKFDVPFSVEGGDAVIGLARSVAGGEAYATTSPIWLSFVQLFDAGHMVPMDQPAAAQTMIHHLSDEPLP